MLAGMFGKLFGTPSGQPVRRRPRPAARRAPLRLEGLEDRLALSPFNLNAGFLTVTGTPGADYFTYSSNPSNHTVTLTLNGASYSVDLRSTFLFGITFDGQGGTDTAAVYDGPTAGEVDLSPGTGDLEDNIGVALHVQHVANIFAYGNASALANLAGTGADTFTGTPTLSYQKGTGFYNLVSGFGRVTASSNISGSDTAYLYGSAAGDAFSSEGFDATDTFAGGRTVTVRDFSTVHAYSGRYGSGVATYTDGTALATLDAGPEHVTVVDPAFVTEADGFARLYAVNQFPLPASDTAVFHGAGNDYFSGGQGFAAMSGPGYSLSAMGFRTVTAYGTGDATEGATLYDSPGNDTFLASPGFAEMYNGSYSVVIHLFTNVQGVDGAGGTDAAFLYDSPGNNTLTAGPTSTTLSGTGFSLQALGFAAVYASAAAGGHDAASLTGGPGGNVFTAHYNSGHLAGAGFDVYINGFAAVDLFTPPGGRGVVLVDSATVNYLLTLHQGWFQL
jgi:hypothetical protein